jgi:glycosyltransferase involved in cell wall biosynthesis
MSKYFEQLVKVSTGEIDLDPNDILLFTCVRNESLRLPYFLDFYKTLGIDHFFIIDNGSTDSSQEILLEHPNAHIFYTTDSYANSHCGVYWVNELLRKYADNHWVVVVDADELLTYPDIENINLPDFIAYLEYTGATALQTFLLDMYSDKTLLETCYIPGKPFIECCQYFDLDTYTYSDSTPYKELRIPIRGGVRQRVFWMSGHEYLGNPPFLPKIPLVKWNKELRYIASTHIINNVKVAEVTGVLLHFKLFSDFVETVNEECKREEHWENANQYKTYLTVVSGNATLNLKSEHSVCYRDSLQLVELGLMQMPSNYRTGRVADVQ